MCIRDSDDAVELTPRYLPERLFMGSRSEDVPAAVEPGAFSFQAMQREAEKRAIEMCIRDSIRSALRRLRILREK